VDHIEISGKLLELSQELSDGYTNASLIIGVVGCVLGAFEDAALSPIAEQANVYGHIVLSVMKENRAKGE